ncbi:VanZ family protein [Marinoscillum sp.]|uniref:VanZ family protein n=1 Tax=Marinoscillum sp. TaxID=2024838 RepID=UPI003BA903FC
MRLLTMKSGQVRVLPFLFFFLFIGYIIYAADADNGSWLIETAKTIKHGDKLGHFLLYGILSFLLNVALNHRKISSIRVPIGSILVLAFALIEEFTQLAFASRTFDWVDMLCDVVGIGLFALITYGKSQTKAPPTSI